MNYCGTLYFRNATAVLTWSTWLHYVLKCRGAPLSYLSRDATFIAFNEHIRGYATLGNIVNILIVY